MKRMIVIIVVALSVRTSFAQSPARIILHGNSVNLQAYLDSINKMLLRQLPKIDSTCSFYATLEIDTNGQIANLKTLEVQKGGLSQATKDYIRTLMQSTNGKWLVKKQEGNAEAINQIVFSICLVKRGEKLESRIRKLSTQTESILSQYGSTDNELAHVIFAREINYITLVVD